MIVVYTKNRCQKCHATKRYLEKNNVEFEEHNIDEEPEARAFVEKLAAERGFKSMPVVLHMWSDFQLDEIKKVIC
jgi:glutaredoxin-like protein NrdH